VEQSKLQPLSVSQRATLEEQTASYAAGLSDDAGLYLHNRGIADAVQRGNRIGVVVNPFPGHERFKGMLSIPYLSNEGEPWDIRFGCIEKHDHEAHFHSKYNTQKDHPMRVYNVKAIFRAGDTIHVTEGECMRGDAQVLTRQGWVAFSDYTPGDEVAQYETSGALRFVKPLAYIKKRFVGNLVERSNQQRYYSLTTPGHRVPSFGGKREPFKFVTAEQGGQTATFIPRVGKLDGPGIDMSDDWLRLLVAISADGTIDVRKDGRQYIRFGFKRERKIERMRKLLANVGIEASDNMTADGHQSICFSMPTPIAFKVFPWAWIADASSEQRELLIAELRQWDGNGVPDRRQEEFSSAIPSNAEWVQALAHTSGRVSTIMQRSNAHGGWLKVSILHGKSTTNWQSLQESNAVPHDGDVYCVTVDSGALLVRMGGCVSVTGNCDALVLEGLGLHAIALPGASMWKPHHRRMLAGFSRVVVWPDKDDAGVMFRDKALAAMSNVVIVDLPHGDVTDVWKAEGAAALLKLLDDKGLNA
jgi:hypothetical protein